VTGDKRSSALDKMRRSHRQHVSANYPAPGICVSRCSDPWPRATAQLLAVVDAVLKLADKWDAEFADGTVFLDREIGALLLRRAVTGELLGEDGADAH
jgi:hypothetical protein